VPPGPYPPPQYQQPQQYVQPYVQPSPYTQQYGQPGQYLVPASPAPYGPYGALPVSPALAGYGADPITGQPYSDKSKLAAGLLQLLLGLFLGLGGIGRLYAGQTALGVVQLVLAVVVGWSCLVCGIFLLGVPFIFSFGLWVWFVVDGIVMLAGRPVDQYGRLLR
jgi:hypothetical protein